MRWKLLAFFIAVIFCSTTKPMSIQAAELKHAFEISTFTSYMSHGSGAKIYDDPVIQATYTLGIDSFYVVLWGSAGLDDAFNNDFGDEIDLFAGKVWQIEKFKIDLSIAYYAMLDIADIDDDTIAILAKMSYDTWLAPYLMIESDYLIGNSDIESGYCLGLKPQWRDVQFDFSITGHDGFGGANAEILESVKAGIAYPIKMDTFTATPQIYFQKSLGDGPKSGGLTESTVWAGLVIAF